MTAQDVKKAYLKWVNRGGYRGLGKLDAKGESPYQVIWIEVELAAQLALEGQKIDPKLAPKLQRELECLFIDHYLDYDLLVKSEYRSVGFAAFLLLKDYEWVSLKTETQFFDMFMRCLRYDFKQWDYVKKFIIEYEIEIPEEILPHNVGDGIIVVD